MNMIDIEELAQIVRGALPSSISAAIDVRVLGESGLQIRVDGEHCLSNIGVWPNGCCDLEHLFVDSELRQSHHLEFTSTSQAAERVISEIHLAMHRAQSEEGTRP
jgi:hypothetical protein